MITSNIAWESWGDYLGDHLGATALVDRMVHHSHVIVINGPSYRDWEHKQEVADARGADKTKTETAKSIAKPTAPTAPATSGAARRESDRGGGSKFVSATGCSNTLRPPLWVTLHKLWIVLSGVALSTSVPSRAHGDTLIGKASKAAAAREFLRALTYADAAIAHPHGSDNERRAVIKARDSYGGRWALQTIANLGPITDANADAAFGQLRSMKGVLTADRIASSPVDTALAQAATLLFTRVNTLESAGDLAQAEALLTVLSDADPTRGDALAALRGRVFAARMAQLPAESERTAHAPTTLLHLQAAARFGNVPATMRTSVYERVEPLTKIVVGGSTSGSCFGQEHGADRAAPADSGVPVHVDVQRFGCNTTGPELIADAAELAYTTTVRQSVPHQHIEDKGYECYREADGQGVTTYTSSYQRPGCVMPLIVVVDDAPEIRDIEVTATEVVATTVTKYVARAAAHVVVSWPGGSLEQDVNAVGVDTSTAYDRPAHALRPTEGAATADRANSRALEDLATTAYAVTGGVKAALATAALARANASTDPLSSEDELIVAALIVRSVSPELVALVDRRYHMSRAELEAALYGTSFPLPQLGESVTTPGVSMSEIDEDERVYHAIFLTSATGRSAYAVSFGFGYARSTGTAKSEHGAFVFEFNFFASYPDSGRVALSTLVDVRYGRGGLLDGRFGFGGGINLHGVLVHPFVGLGFDRLGLSDPTTVHYGVAAVAEVGLRLGFAIPHLFATDATFARRRRLDVASGEPVVENRLDAEFRVQPFVLDLQYTQLSSESSDLLNGPTLAHETAQLFELLLGYGF